MNINNKKLRVCYRPIIAEITEKKSKFIANISKVENEAEASDFILKMKKKYSDARHNCYAYIIDGEFEIFKYSDDGEPSQTAGKPMLDILKNENITDTCVVVTRYFGGILLGTGGLVKAYQEATKQAILKSKFLERAYGSLFEFEIDYPFYGKVKYFIESNNFHLLNIEYAQNIIIKVLTKLEDRDRFIQELNNIMASHINMKIKLCSYLIDEDKVILERLLS